MRLIAQPLHKIQHRIIAPQRHHAFAHPVEFFFAVVAVHAFGHPHHRHILDAILLHDLTHRTHLPCAPIDQQKVRPHAFIPIRIFLQQPLKPPVQHLFHHAKVIPRRDVIPLDVELAIAVFHEPFRPGDNHAAHRIGALNVAVVVDLNALRRPVKIKHLRHPLQQLGLRGGLTHFTGQAFPRIPRRTFHKLCLLAALGHGDLNLAPRLGPQRLRHQLGVFNGMRQDQLPWRLLAVIELPNESLQHLSCLHIHTHARIEIPVAPVLIGSDEEHLHTGLTLLQMQRNHIRLRHATRVDALRLLHRSQRPNAIAQCRGFLKLHRLGCRLHLLGQGLLNLR